MFEGLFQPMHLMLILVIVLIIFGPGKLPQIGSGLGKIIYEFKKAMAEGKAEVAKIENSKTEAETAKLEEKKA